MDMDKKRWLTLLASCMINLCIGSVNAWSVFSSPMAEYLSGFAPAALTAGSMAIVFTLANGVSPFTMISGGAINDKLGPKWAVLIGGILEGGGMILASMAHSLPLVVIGYGVISGLGMGLVYSCTIGNTIKLFPDKRGLAGGLATATYGLSSTVISPLANALIGRMGVMPAFRTLGICYTVIICVGAFLIVRCPDGYAPKGWMISKVDSGDETVNLTWRQMLRSPVFYSMLLMLLCGAFFGLMTISQASPIAQNMIGMSVAAASAVVAVLALFNAGGRLLCGFLSDHLGILRTLVAALLLAIVGLALLFTCQAGQSVKFVIGICIVGVCFGAFMGIFPGFTASQFGSRNNSVNYGIMFIGFALAGLLGPSAMSTMYNRSGSYQPAFLIAIGLALLGIGAAFLFQWFDRKRYGQRKRFVPASRSQREYYTNKRKPKRRL